MIGVLDWIRRFRQGGRCASAPAGAADEGWRDASGFDDARRLRSFGYPEIVDTWLFEIITDSRRA